MAESPSDAAKRRFLADQPRPRFVNDWTDVVFLHFEVDAAALIRALPFELDLFHGKALVSAVAFAMSRARPLGWATLTRPVAALLTPRRLLNVRAYVRHEGEPGICFLSEWLSNPLAARFGPFLYGLPSHAGRLDYESAESGRALYGRVTEGENAFAYSASLAGKAIPCPAAPASLEEFCVERYTAFSAQGRRTRRFRIWHEPWPLVPLEASITDQSLINTRHDWFTGARLTAAHFSPGLRDIWVGRMVRL